MKRIFIAIIAGLITNSIIAQGIGSQNTGAVTVRDLFDPGYNNTSTYDEKYDNIEGSPYFNDDWKRGKILLNDDTKFDGVDLKLDLYQNRLLLLDEENEESASLVKKTLVKEFSIRGSRFFNDLDHGYIQELSSGGKLKLFKKTVIEVKEAKPATGYNTGDVNPKFERREEFLVLDVEKLEMIVLSPQKKKRLETLNSFTKANLKESKLNVRKVEDLIQIVEIINSDS